MPNTNLLGEGQWHRTEWTRVETSLFLADGIRGIDADPIGLRVKAAVGQA